MREWIGLDWIVLYCIVLYCIVLYCIVLYCIVLYCIILYCILLYSIVLYCLHYYYCCVHFCLFVCLFVWSSLIWALTLVWFIIFIPLFRWTRRLFVSCHSMMTFLPILCLLYAHFLVFRMLQKFNWNSFKSHNSMLEWKEALDEDRLKSFIGIECSSEKINCHEKDEERWVQRRGEGWERGWNAMIRSIHKMCRSIVWSTYENHL